MKTLLKTVPIAILVMALASCVSQKGVVSNTNKAKADTEAVVSEVLHYQALAAMEDNEFVIQAKQFFYPNGKHAMQSSLDSYISMQGSEVVFKFDQNARRYMFLDRELISKDSQAQITKGKVMKNGDVQYVLTTKSSQRRIMCLTMLITLYKDSNECSVRIDIDNPASTNNITTIKGAVYPLNDSASVD